MIRKALPFRPRGTNLREIGSLPDGESLLVRIDFYSTFIELVEIHDIKAASTIKSS